jgi:hypothetical protein
MTLMRSAHYTLLSHKQNEDNLGLLKLDHALVLHNITGLMGTLCKKNRKQGIL